MQYTRKNLHCEILISRSPARMPGSSFRASSRSQRSRLTRADGRRPTSTRGRRRRGRRQRAQPLGEKRGPGPHGGEPCESAKSRRCRPGPRTLRSRLHNRTTDRTAKGRREKQTPLQPRIPGYRSQRRCGLQCAARVAAHQTSHVRCAHTLAASRVLYQAARFYVFLSAIAGHLKPACPQQEYHRKKKLKLGLAKKRKFVGNFEGIRPRLYQRKFPSRAQLDEFCLSVLSEYENPPRSCG